MASPTFAKQLDELSRSTSSPTQRAEAYNQLLASIISAPDNISNNLIAYAQSILGDNIGVIHSRPLLSSFIEQYRTVSDNDVRIESGASIADILAPKIVSYENQDSELKFLLADAHEANEDYTSSAKTLQTITLDSSQRSVTEDERAKVWMRICRCYLEEDDHTNALTYLNKVKQVIFDISDQTTRLQFQLSQARISDSQRNFLDASSSYLQLSTETIIDEEERLQALSAAITCAVLAPAGPLRARQLGKLYKDERASETAEYGILEKIFLDRLLSPVEVRAFAAGLAEHQLAKTSDGSTVLDKAVLEHNLLAASRLYANIALPSLGALLGVDADRAETYAATMIESNRLSGSIDQIEGLIYFNTKEGASEMGRDLRHWENNVQGLAEEVEKITTMLQRDEATCAPADFGLVLVYSGTLLRFPSWKKDEKNRPARTKTISRFLMKDILQETALVLALAHAVSLRREWDQAGLSLIGNDRFALRMAAYSQCMLIESRLALTMIPIQPTLQSGASRVLGGQCFCREILNRLRR
nr:cop9 signalosome complex subunit 4 [Quercus suber]